MARFLRSVYSSFIWLIVLVPILAVSAYSLYWVATHFGVPWYFAIFMSTCFDGAALVGADYSLKYAQAGLSGGTPRTFVRILALISAFLQTFHSRLAGEPEGAWILWASLPVIAVFLYDIHIRFERRKALARAGRVYPSGLPQYGLARWILFPWRTLNDFRDILVARSHALQLVSIVATEDFSREARRIRNTREVIEPAPAPEAAEPAQEATAEVASPEVMEQHRQRRAAQPRAAQQRYAPGSWNARHKPEIRIREWALDQACYRGRVGQRGPLPADVKEDYYRAFPGERSG